MPYKDPAKRKEYQRHYRQEHREGRAAASHRWYWENRQKNLARMRHYNEEHRDERRAYMYHYYQEHREERATYMRHWRYENPEKAAANQRRWRKKNPEKIAAQFARYRAHKRALPNTLTAGQAELLMKIGRITYPGEELHLDHIVPLSKGGGTTLANMVAIPASLNRAKQDKLPRQVYRQKELL